MVTGAVAVLRSMNPRLRVDTLRNLLLEGTTDLGEPGRDPVFGAGALDGLKLRVLASPRIVLPFTPSNVYPQDRPISVGVHLPPTDTKTQVFIGLRGPTASWWLGPGGTWHLIAESPLGPVASLDAYAMIIEGTLFGDDGVYPAFDPMAWDPGAYEWIIAQLDLRGRLIGPVTVASMSLEGAPGVGPE